MRRSVIWLSALLILSAILACACLFVDWLDAQRAERVFRQWRDPGGDVKLASLLADRETADVRETAVRLLVQRYVSSAPVGEAAVAKLALSLSDSSPEVRVQAAKAFWVIGAVQPQAQGEGVDASLVLSEHLPKLLRAVGDVSPDVRENLAYALGYAVDASAVEALRRLAEDANADVRAAAAEALSYASEPKELRLDVLSRVRNDRDPLVRLCAIGSLHVLRGQTVGDAKEAETMLWHERTAVRRYAAYIVGVMGSSAEVPSLHRVALSDTSVDVRSRAVCALAKIGGDGSVAALKDIAASPEAPEAVKARARSFLSQILEREAESKASQ